MLLRGLDCSVTQVIRLPFRRGWQRKGTWRFLRVRGLAVCQNEAVALPGGWACPVPMAVLQSPWTTL